MRGNDHGEEGLQIFVRTSHKSLTLRVRGGSRGTSNNCVGEQRSKYRQRKTKL